MTSARTDGGEDALATHLDSLATILRETEVHPVAPAASVWLGEAHAVAEDLTRGDTDPSVITERVGHVQHLLENTGDVENETVAESIEDALELTETIRATTADAAEE